MKLKHVIFSSYFLAIFILSRLQFFSFSLSFLQNSIFEAVPWFLGAFIGAYFIKLEQIVYAYFVKPQDALSMQIRQLLKTNKGKQLASLLRQRVGEQKLAFRSAIFQVVWVVLAFFTLTSTNVVLGKTMVMGIGLHLLLDEWQEIRKGKSLSWLFWQVKREVKLGEQKIFLWIVTFCFVVLSLLLI